MKDTARILIDWACNLSCDYCCNKQERFRKEILPVNINDIDFKKYKTICISGGEPLLFIDKLFKVIRKIPSSKFIVLYTNGIFLTPYLLKSHDFLRINAINVGLHKPESFTKLISRIEKDFSGSSISIRFHLNEFYNDIGFEEVFPDSKFKYWKMDDCERDNEDRFILTGDY